MENNNTNGTCEPRQLTDAYKLRKDEI